MLDATFFDQDACLVARQLLGKVIRRRYKRQWLSARIIETEAYYLEEKGSHASLGYTEKRRALFMPAGTIYMYYARGKDSFNVSCQGQGNAVLIKSAYPYFDQKSPASTVTVMQALNPMRSGITRTTETLCNGQTLLCKSLGITVKQWNGKQFDMDVLYIEDVAADVEKIIQTSRLGIPAGRDEDLPYRFIDYEYAPFCSSNPLSKRIEVSPLTILSP